VSGDNDREKLQRGRVRKPRPKQGLEPSPDYPPDPNLMQRLIARRRRRRAATKARVAAMSRRRRYARRGLIAGTWLLGLIAGLMVTTLVLFYTLSDVRRPEDIRLPQVATIQYADGSTLANVGTVNRTLVHLDQVPTRVRWAVLAAEDRGFYSEPGFSITGTLRAAFSDVTGGDTQGGSGITQQYVKNAYLSDAQSLSRKLKELMIAVKLSREYSKDQILEFYLNTVYFGRNTYGIEAAAKAYFGEDVEQLTTAQGALLAAVLRAPSYYDPAAHHGQAVARWHYVLDGMVSTGHLTQPQADAMRFPTTKPPGRNRLVTKGWKSLLVNKVMADLQAHGISQKEAYNRGITIRTTIDKKAQHAALAAVRQTTSHLTKQQRNLENALVAVNPADGGVLAYYGGTGPGVQAPDGKVNFNDYASNGDRPPGSSFKPYTLATVLTQTLHQTIGKAHYAIDSKVPGSQCATVEGTKICNDPGDRSVSAPLVTIETAMKYSLNTTFDLLASQAGPDKVAAIAHRMGVADKDFHGNKTLVEKNGTTNFGIGIGDYPVSPMDQAAGFATLANDGVRNDPYFVSKATASDGAVLYEHKAAPSHAISPRVANDVTLTLEPVAAASGAGLQLAGGRVSAAKTGTEGIGKNTTNNSDAWMVGYTPQVSAAVWFGTGYSRPIFNSGGAPMYGSDEPGKTWQVFMDDYLAGTPKLPMAKYPMISTDGSLRGPEPTHTPSVPAPTTSQAPTPTFTITTGFPSQTSAPPSTLPAPPSSSTPPPSSPSAPSSPSGTCTGLVSIGCHTRGK
jgi:membrane peptidoglycan carboxypeptidase